MFFHDDCLLDFSRFYLLLLEVERDKPIKLPEFSTTQRLTTNLEVNCHQTVWMIGMKCTFGCFVAFR